MKVGLFHDFCYYIDYTTLGIEVEMRPIHINEVSSFQEVAACGTAVGKCHGID